MSVSKIDILFWFINILVGETMKQKPKTKTMTVTPKNINRFVFMDNKRKIRPANVRDMCAHLKTHFQFSPPLWSIW